MADPDLAPAAGPDPLRIIGMVQVAFTKLVRGRLSRSFHRWHSYASLAGAFTAINLDMRHRVDLLDATLEAYLRDVGTLKHYLHEGGVFKAGAVPGEVRAIPTMDLASFNLAPLRHKAAFKEMEQRGLDTRLQAIADEHADDGTLTTAKGAHLMRGYAPGDSAFLTRHCAACRGVLEFVYARNARVDAALALVGTYEAMERENAKVLREGAELKTRHDLMVTTLRSVGEKLADAELRLSRDEMAKQFLLKQMAAIEEPLRRELRDARSKLRTMTEWQSKAEKFEKALDVETAAHTVDKEEAKVAVADLSDSVKTLEEVKMANEAEIGGLGTRLGETAARLEVNVERADTAEASLAAALAREADLETRLAASEAEAAALKVQAEKDAADREREMNDMVTRLELASSGLKNLQSQVKEKEEKLRKAFKDKEARVAREHAEELTAALAELKAGLEADRAAAEAESAAAHAAQVAELEAAAVAEAAALEARLAETEAAMVVAVAEKQRTLEAAMAQVARGLEEIEATRAAGAAEVDRVALLLAEALWRPETAEAEAQASVEMVTSGGTQLVPSDFPRGQLWRLKRAVRAMVFVHRVKAVLAAKAAVRDAHTIACTALPEAADFGMTVNLSAAAEAEMHASMVALAAEGEALRAALAAAEAAGSDWQEQAARARADGAIEAARLTRKLSDYQASARRLLEKRVTGERERAEAQRQLVLLMSLRVNALKKKMAGLLAEIDAHRGEDDPSPETALPPVKVGRGKKAPRSSVALARIFKKAVHTVIEKRRGRVLRLRQAVMLTKADHDRQLEADKKRAKAFAKALEADAAKLGDAALDGIKRSADLAVAWQKKLKQAAFERSKSEKAMRAAHADTAEALATEEAARQSLVAAHESLAGEHSSACARLIDTSAALAETRATAERLTDELEKLRAVEADLVTRGERLAGRVVEVSSELEARTEAYEAALAQTRADLDATRDRLDAHARLIESLEEERAHLLERGQVLMDAVEDGYRAQLAGAARTEKARKGRQVDAATQVSCAVCAQREGGVCVAADRESPRKKWGRAAGAGKGGKGKKAWEARAPEEAPISSRGAMLLAAGLAGGGGGAGALFPRL